MQTTQVVVNTVLIGVGATAVMDAWLVQLSWLGVPKANFALIGRWVGHMARGRFAHQAIATASPIASEQTLGWLTHYAVGVAFAGLLVALRGSQWLHQPTLAPALAVGAATVVMPLFVMQPAMGSGFAASKTATPLKNCLRSLANHSVFGLGMFLSATVFSRHFH